MLAIWKREWKAYFQNIIGWLFIAAVTALYGIYFIYYNLNNGVVYISYPLYSIAGLFLIAMPILTMRSFAEEKKNKTDQLILTAPVSLGKVVFGKFFALVSVYLVVVVLLGLTPLLLCKYGTVPIGENLVVLLGFFLYGTTFLAIGMFISSLTESQVIAAVISFVVFFVSYMIDSIASLISATENGFTKFCSYLNISTPFQNFLNGCLDLTSVVYYISITLLFLFLTAQVIQKRRWNMSKKRITFGAFSLGLIAIIMAVTVGANMVVRIIPTKFTSIDCSYSKLYALDKSTESYMKGLDQNVTIYVLQKEADKDTQIAETLSRISDLSKHVQVEYVDTTLNPNFYKQYTDTAPKANSLIVVGENRSRVIDYSDLYVYEYTADSSSYYGYSYNVTGYDAEGQIVSAIEYVTMAQENLPVVYCITDHGENALGTSISTVLEKANIVCQDLELFNADSIPEDASAIIINSPQNDFNETDINKVKDYLAKGGKALVVGDCTNQNLPNFYSLFEEYGVNTVPGLVVDNDSSSYYRAQGQFFLLPKVNSTGFTPNTSGAIIVAPQCEGFTYGEQENITYTSLVDTSENSLVKTDYQNMKTYEYEDGDYKGSVSVLLAVEKTNDDESKTQIIFAGSPYIFADYAASYTQNNATVFEDLLKNLIDTSELSKANVVAAKDISLSSVTVPANVVIALGTLLAVVIPIACLAAGIGIWAKRRKQ